MLPKFCCDDMLKELERDVLLCVMETLPFSHHKMPPTVYLQSDGGHGGMEAIRFCPFCGERIVWVSEDTNESL